LDPKGIVFDVDGTLVDSNDAHARAFVESFRSFGFEIRFEQVRPLIGAGSDKLIPELIGRYDEAIAGRKKAIFLERYLQHVRPFPRVGELLRALDGMGLELAVASSAAKDELERLLELTGAKECFAQPIDAEEAGRSKPDPDSVQAALRSLELPPQRCVMVGDTPYDAVAAHSAGVAFIGLRCGGWADLQPARRMFEDPADLLAHLESWTGARREHYRA
jgi:HAD superfamily hydrolase (TIGR01509 family)